MSKETRDLPARRTAPTLDRAALERVLARAAELQSSSGDTVEEFTEQQLVELGQEVGLSAAHLRQALAEERTRVVIPENQGRLGEFFGPSMIAVRRMVPLPPAALLQRLERWMDREEVLQVKRRFADRVTWEARRDFLGSIKRGFNVGGRGYSLSSALEVAATATSVDDGNTLVQLSADFTPSRRRAVGGAVFTGGLMAGSGGLLVAVAMAFGGSALLAGALSLPLAGLGAGSAFLFARHQRELLSRGQLALEQALDQLERAPEGPASVLGSLLDAAVRDLR
jgi:hypothetical protein